MSRDWVSYICKFCNREMVKDSVIPPSCDCDGYQQALEEWLEEYRASDDYSPPLTPEEYDEKYPSVYFGERLVTEEDSAHKLKLEARKFESREGLVVWIPFPYKTDETVEEDEEGAGLCWDFTDRDAEALHELLGEYLEQRKCR